MPYRLPVRWFSAFVLAVLALPAGRCLAAPGPRADIPLENWRFQPGTTGAQPKDADWIPIGLPYCWTATWLRPKAADGTSWAKQDLRDLNSAWYEADVPVPADWQGRRVLLDLRGVQCDAVVWADGRRVAEVKGPDGRVDLTGVAAPGKAVRLRLWVTRWWEQVENQRERDLFRHLAIADRARSEWYHSEEDVRKATPGGISEGVTLRALPPTAEIENVTVATDFRRKELRVSVETRIIQTVAGDRLRLQVSERDGSTEGLPGTTVPVADAPARGQSGAQSVTLPWANPRLWEVGAPYLYLLQVSLVDRIGDVVDAYAPVRFGFREVWTEGKDLILNGHPLRLRPGYFTQSVAQMHLFEGMGFNTIVFQPNPSGWYSTWGLFPSGLQGGSKELLDAADEHGWAVYMPVPGVSVTRDALLAPAAQAAYLRDLRTWLGRLDRQNRPSILMWTPSMNTQGYPAPEGVGRRPTTTQPAWYAKVEELIRSVDATRLIYHHAGGQTGDVETANLYLNWVPLAEQEEYLSAWSRAGEKPWAGVEHGSPLTVDFFRRRVVPYFTEYAGIYLGDAAYTAEKDEYVRASLRAQEKPAAGSAFEGVSRFAKAGDLAHIGEWTAYNRIMDLYLRGVNRSWRAWGMNGGIFPWYFDVGFGVAPGCKVGNMGHLYEGLTGTPEELRRRPPWANTLYDAYRDTMQPLLVYLGGPAARFTAKEPRYSAGETAERSIVAVWDGPGEKAFTARWSLQAAGKRVDGGEETFRMGPGAIEKRPLRFVVPQVTARTPARLSLAVSDASGTALVRDETALLFFPPQPPAVALKARWGIYDPAGKSAAEWTRIGLRGRAVPAGGSVKDLDVLVIGAGALGRESRLPFTGEDVRRGLRVLVLEQSLDALEALGFRAQDVVPRYVFPRVRSHAALAGITEEDLRNWRGEGRLLPAASAGRRVWPWPHGPHVGNTGSVASVVIETPHKGAFTPLLECEFDLAYTPLLSWQQGRGSVLFSQLDFAGRLGAEPAADRRARGLLRALDAPASGEQNGGILLLGDSPEAKALMGDLGLRWRAYGAGSLPARSVVVLAPGAAPAAGQHRQELERFVAAGGTVLFLPQDAVGLGAAGLPWPLPLRDARAARVDPASLGEDPLLRGIGPQLLHWRTFVEGAAFAPEGLPSGARRLLDGWLLRVGAGKGQWVFCQVDWRRLEDDSHNLRRARWNARRFYRQLLTNVGAATEDGVAAQMLSPRRFAPMAPVGVWQVLQAAAPIAPEVGKENSLPGLNAPLPAEAWVANPTAGRRRDFTWRLQGVDKNGYLDLARVATARLGQAGYAVTHVYSSVARNATVALSADYWFVFRANGAVVVDQGRGSRAHAAPKPGEVRVRVPLRAGWNRLEMKVASGSGGFGFWCQVSDPGDLRVSPTLTPPAQAPGEAPAPADLREEPLVTGDTLLYAETLQKEDDPYGFSAW